MSPSGRKIGLALGGGGARGMAHVGVLSVLERAGVPIDYVAGTSAGALMGALYCAGIGAERIREAAMQIRWRDLARLVWPARGFVSFAKMEDWLVNFLGDLSFADLAIPLAVVVTDLGSGRPVILCEGRVAPAVRASCSVPGLVTPVELDGRLLGDGGVTNNLPASAVRALGAEYIIGVDLMASTPRKGWGAPGFGLAAMEILVRRAGSGLDAVDCLISPNLAGASYVRLSKRLELIALGEKAARQKLPLIQAAL